jgi:hypothetical protein
MTATELVTLIKQMPHQPGAPPLTLEHGRSALCQWFFELGFTRGAEIGVWEGGFAHKICRPNPRLELLCVDPWASQADYQEVKNDAARMEHAFQCAKQLLKPYRCTFLRMTSQEAVAHVADGSLDFVYIDGNHLFDHVTRDLTLWAPKVRSGGVIAGHDYKDSARKPFIQVKPAVDRFTKDRGISPWFVLAADKSPSYFWMVP